MKRTCSDQGHFPPKTDFNSGESSKRMKISLIKSSDITNNQVKIWAPALRAVGVELSTEYSEGDTSYIVTGTKCSALELKKYCGDVDPMSGVRVMNATWISEFVKKRKAPDDEDPRFVHALQPRAFAAVPLSSSVVLDVSSSSSSVPSLGNSVTTTGRTSSTTIDDINGRIICIFKQLSEIYDVKNDQIRSKAYRTACSILKKLEPIMDISILRGIKGLGDNLRGRALEIYTTGKLKLLESLKQEPEISSFLIFRKIWGVGLKKSHDLYRKGCRTIEDVRTMAQDSLTVQQRIGLNHYEDFNERMPASEASEIEKIVRECVQSIDPNVSCIACGSFRRGEPTCGDVDILIGPPPGANFAGVLPRILKLLRESRFLTSDLAVSSDGGAMSDTESSDEEKEVSLGDQENDKRTSYMGVCKLPGENTKFRRIDIKEYSRTQYPFALLYFTGPEIFNR